tara:strand:- start:173 stop:487 length:315 start_codon:yes stop_codon:yes gene_type:complete
MLIREIYINYYEIYEDEKGHIDNLEIIEEELSIRLLDVFSKIYNFNNMNNLVSKKILSFLSESTKEDFLDKVYHLAGKLDEIFLFSKESENISEIFIEELFKTM